MIQFSFSRFTNLVKKQWIENRRLYIMSVLALLGILAIAITFWLIAGGGNYKEDSVYAIGLSGLFITGAIFASTSFNMLNAKDTGIYWISFPASHLEKLLTVLFYNVIIFSVIYFLCFQLLKFAGESYINVLMQKEPSTHSFQKVDWANKKGIAEALPLFLFAFFIIQAAFLLGAASFKKFPFIITIIVVAAVAFLTIYYLIKLSKGLIPNGYYYQLVNVKSNDVDGVYKEYNIHPFLKGFIEVCLKYLLAPFLWLVTLFKLKEKEI